MGDLQKIMGIAPAGIQKVSGLDVASIQKVMGLTYPVAAPSNLVTNGDMELDSNWSNFNTPTTNERSTTQIHGGTYSRKYITNAINEGILSDIFTLTNGVTYQFTFWVYSSNTKVYSNVQQQGGAYYTPSQVENTVTANTWTQFIHDFTATETNANMSVSFFTPAAGTNTVYVDDVEIKVHP
jgi:hypothetical protein